MERICPIHNSKATPRVSSFICHPRKRGNECIYRKIRPEKKTYGMTISLTNRVMVCASISNLGAVNYWNVIYSSLKLDMSHETTAFFPSQDQIRDYKKHYRSLARVKIKIVSDNNIKIKNLMQKQKIDDKKGMTYGDGVAMECTDTLPSQIKLAEDDKKKLLGVKFPFYGCFVKGYVTNKAKRCQYHSCYDDDEIKNKMNTHLQKIHPMHYGECFKYSSRITDPRNCLHGLQNCIHRGVTDSTFAFY